MNFSRFFAYKLVQAAKSGKDEQLRKVQSDIFTQFKNDNKWLGFHDVDGLGTCWSFPDSLGRIQLLFWTSTRPSRLVL